MPSIIRLSLGTQSSVSTVRLVVQRVLGICLLSTVAIRGTDSLLDAKVDANIIRSWLSDVAYGRCVTSAKDGIGEDMYQELMASV